MKTVYTVHIRALDPDQHPGHRYQFAASNPHFAVREVLYLAGRQGKLPRGWKRLGIEVTR